jgi:5S rRNA maturation endonuclease (ribonuclease M5)
MWCHCERAEYAGSLELDERTEPATYLHRIGGSCRCGAEHAPALKESNGRAPWVRRKVAQTYDYTDVGGAVLYQTVRYEPKDFRQRRPDGHGGWIWNLDGIERVPYRLPEVLANPVATVVIVEGEKDADRLTSLGLIATTNAGGAGKWTDALSEYLIGHAQVVVIPDNDEPGMEHVEAVARSVSRVVADVRVVELTGLAEKSDVSDWDGDVDALNALIAAAPVWSESPDTVPPLSTPIAHPKMPDSLDAAAYIGLAGEVVHAIDPHTEADPAAVLLSFLVAFGNAIGERAHCVVGATDHPARIFAAMVGETARARKGDSWAAVRRLMVAADPEWAGTRIQGGLSSGEGVIAAVRDPIEQTDKKTGELVIVDAGVSDKRLLVVEPELARTLRVMHRDGSTLSTILRDGWDTGTLRVMTKTPLRATGAHVSVISHITVEELRRELDETSLANGFANRFLWLSVRRSKLLPEPEPFAGAVVESLARRIGTAIVSARGTDVVERDDEAREVWRAVYPELTADRPGILGHILNRAEAQAVRLSLIYALLDRSMIIRRVHLDAALAVLDYVDASVGFIFANRLGDPIADAILRAIDETGEKTRNQIRDLFSQHVTAERMAAALATLVDAGLLVRESRPTGGRPVEIWKRPG